MAGSRLRQWELPMETTLSATSQGLERVWSVLVYDEVSSTMDAARSQLDQVSEQRPALVMARVQTQGRGRQGRAWSSLEGNFLGTFVFALSKREKDLAGFSLVSSVVLSRILLELGCKILVKWPNDLICIQGRKLSGILIELVQRAERSFVLTGFGVNLLHSPPEFGNAVAVRDLIGQTLTPVELAVRLADRLYLAWQKYEQQGFLPFRDEWLSHAAYLGARVTYRTGAGDLSGKFVGVDESGYLLLLDPAGSIRMVASGHMIET